MIVASGSCLLFGRCDHALKRLTIRIRIHARNGIRLTPQVVVYTRVIVQVEATHQERRNLDRPQRRPPLQEAEILIEQT